MKYEFCRDFEVMTGKCNNTGQYCTEECKNFILVSKADITVFEKQNSLWDTVQVCKKCGFHTYRLLPYHRCPACGKRVIYNEKEYDNYDT